jgi:cyclopropane fatty-acyl-phospholipid synthase-like methyltransferase
VANRFRDSIGIDIFDYAAEFEIQKNKAGAVHCRFEQLDLENKLPEEKYDRLISFEVIEHLKNDDSVKAYHDLLHPGALAAITVPNKWWVFETHGARLPLLPWNRVPFFSWLPSFIHERYANARIYTMRRITRLMIKHGFDVIDHCYVTAPMDVLKEGWLKRQLVKYVFGKNKTSIPFLSTSIFILAKKK